jgi:nitrogen regulatory protein PII
MKMVLGVADAARMDALRRALHEAGVPGYTELPVVEGEGRTGLHTGDRVHPGALVAVFTIVEDRVAPSLFEELVRRRNAAGDQVTRFFILPVERQG